MVWSWHPPSIPAPHTWIQKQPCPPGLDALDDAPDGVLLAQQAQARRDVLVDRLARHEGQRLARDGQHLPPEEAASLQLEQAVDHLVERRGDACGSRGQGREAVTSGTQMKRCPAQPSNQINASWHSLNPHPPAQSSISSDGCAGSATMGDTGSGEGGGGRSDGDRGSAPPPPPIASWPSRIEAALPLTPTSTLPRRLRSPAAPTPLRRCRRGTRVGERARRCFLVGEGERPPGLLLPRRLRLSKRRDDLPGEAAGEGRQESPDGRFSAGYLAIQECVGIASPSPTPNRSPDSRTPLLPVGIISGCDSAPAA